MGNASTNYLLYASFSFSRGDTEMIWLCMYKSRVSSSAAMKVKVVKVPDETIHYLQPQAFFIRLLV